MKLFSELYNHLEKLSFKQLFEHFEYKTKFQHKDFVVLCKDSENFLIYINEQTNIIESVNLSTFAVIEKSIFFIKNSLSLNLLTLEGCIKRIPFKKEYSLVNPRSFYHCATIFFQNKLIDFSKINYSNLKNVLSSPIFDGQLSINHTTGLFSLPMFTDLSRNVVNFCDFKENYYSFRNNDSFSFWADPISLKEDYNSEGGTILISFNPFSIMESSLYMISGHEEKFSFSLFQGPVTFDKVFKFSSVLPVLNSQKIVFCYSPSLPFYAMDCNNILSFVLNMINLYDKGFVFSFSPDNNGGYDVYIVKYPKEFSFVDFDDIIMGLNKMVKEQFCNSQSLTDSDIYSNYSILDPFLFHNNSLKLPDKRRIYCINFSALPDLIFILLTFLKDKFELNYDYLSVSGELLFQMSPI